MIPLLIKLLGMIVGLIEEHPDLAKGLLSRALELLHHGQATPAGSTGANILRNQQAAEAGLQAGIAAAMSAAATSVHERQKQVEREAEAARERQHDFDHGVGADDPMPFSFTDPLPTVHAVPAPVVSSVHHRRSQKRTSE